jgi:hypothetical protein
MPMVESLKLVLGRINKEAKCINLRKSRFLAEEVDFLGQRIGKNGIQPMKKDKHLTIHFIKPRKAKEMKNSFGREATSSCLGCNKKL